MSRSRKRFASVSRKHTSVSRKETRMSRKEASVSRKHASVSGKGGAPMVTVGTSGLVAWSGMTVSDVFCATITAPAEGAIDFSKS